MIDWIRRKIAKWGWYAYEHEERLKIIGVNDYRSVHVCYTYNGDVKVSVCNLQPFKSVATLNVAYPNLNTVTLMKHLESEELQSPTEEATQIE